MIHDIAYYKKIQNAYLSQSKKQTDLHVLSANVRSDFYQSLNWEAVTVDGTSQDVLITKGENEKVKKIKSKPGENLYLGDIIGWADTYWMMTQMDYDDQLHCAGKMTQCNTILKWQLDDLSIHSEYAVADDATKYGTGVTETQYIQTVEFTLKIRVPVNEYTLAIKQDRRFLLGFSGTNYQPHSFIVSRLNVQTGTMDLNSDNTVPGHGYLEITMMEDQVRQDHDNLTLGVADYTAPPSGNEGDTEPEEESGWFG